MDDMERVRMAGAFVEFLRRFDYSDADIVATADAMKRHLAVEKMYENPGEAVVASVVICSQN